MRNTSLLLIVLVVGCGGGAETPPLIQVSGTVTHAGRPVDHLQVFFQPVGGGRASSGLTDENGEFKLSYTREEEGVVAGEHKVHVAYRAETPEQETRPPEPYAAILAKYGDGSSSPLTVTVDDDSSDLELALD